MRTGLATAALLLAIGARAEVQEREGQPPFAEALDRAAGYLGPGREAPEPSDVAEVRIGYFGPSDPSHLEGGPAWRGASLAIEQENALGGYRARPFRLLSAWSDNPWAAGVVQLARLVYEERVWAIVGGADGAGTHLAEQVAAKARIAVVSPISTDKTVNLANVPWVFSCLPSDDRQAEALGPFLAAASRGGGLAVASALDHDGRAAAAEFRSVLWRLQAKPVLHVELRPEAREFKTEVDRLLAARPAAVLVLGGPQTSGRLLAALRRAGYAGSVFGGASLGRRAFLEEAGGHAEGAVLPSLTEPSDVGRRFEAAFRRRFDAEPDFAAAQSYDAVRLVVAAVRRAGLNRARIRDAIPVSATAAGAAGSLRFDALGRSGRPVHAAEIVAGRVQPLAVQAIR